MPGNNENNSNSNNPTKIITLDNLSTYTDYIERKGIDISYDDWLELTPAEKQGKTFYIYDYPDNIGVEAYEVEYDNTSSSLQADDVQEAIDELKELIDQGGGGGTDTTYTLSVGTGADADKIVLTPSTGNPDKVTVPYATNAGAVNSHTVATDVPADAVFTDTTYSNATTTTAGLMSAADKITVDGLGTAASKDVASSGDASATEVVMGNDSRLTNARNAADVYDWAKASTKPSYTAVEIGAIASTEKGANNGVAELDSTGKVPSSQLPSYVDDVLEYDSTSVFPSTGETGKIYVAKDTNKTYRWSGTDYVEISESLALGETSSTAYAGNKGKANADAIAAIKDGSTIDSFGDVETALTGKVDTVAQGTTNGTISVTKNGSTSDVAVKGLQNSAYNNTFVGTEDEWDNLTTEQKKAYDEYKITDDYVEPTDPTAADISYDNTTSGLTADDVQDAIDELASEKKDEYTTITYAQWQQLTPTQQAEKDYYISDYPTSPVAAGNINYSNTSSGMTADDVQEAVDELASEKKDEYTTITYAQWQALTPAQQSAKDYYISDYPSSQITAGNVGYSNTTSGISANNVQGAVDELKSGLTNLIAYVSDSVAVGENIAVGATVRKSIALPTKSGYNLASANGRLNYTDSAVVSCQIRDNTNLDCYITNTRSFVLENQTLYYRLIYVKTNI